jgi:non-lysosomal glucosylceramidase
MPSDKETENKREGLGRRTFLKSAGMLGAGLFTTSLPVAAGPFLPGESSHGGVPENKKLHEQWIGSLTERGIPTTYLKSKNELRFIGMPVGGIMTGTLYLGGDGRLWLWDIFNSKQRGIDPKEILWEPLGRKVGSTDGAAYLEPPPPSAKQGIEQGFAIKAKSNGKEYIRQLREADWEEVSFTGQYPLATIQFTDSSLPFYVTMEAYSPFIPLNADDSGLPATVFSITVHNKDKSALEASLVGWLENASLFFQKDKTSFKRQNSLIKKDNLLAVFCETTQDTTDSKIAQLPDYGTMCLSLLSDNGIAYTNFNTLDLSAFNFKQNDPQTVKDKQELLTCGLLQDLKVLPDKSQTANFILSWHFPNSDLNVKDTQTGNYYSKKFKDAFEVAQYLGKNFQRLEHDTKLWRDTWQDSTLPHWFLERTFSNTSTLATTTCHRFGTGRFWSWEGVGCCEGTCTHVWQYAQAVARTFPEIERDTRERVDLGLAFNDQTGEIGYRGEGTGEAIDGQAGTVLRIYREHQLSKDNSFLQTNWPHIKKAVEFILNHDTNKDGIIDGAQPNTLDAAWYGEISWISSLCLAGWRAGEEMALAMNDAAFAEICHERFLTGKKNIEDKLFNGEYFIQLPGKEGKKYLGSYDTCLIDQVFGQSYAYQVGLGRILDKEKMQSALKSLWKYNFMRDVGPYIAHHKGGRPYVLSGEGGMLMDTNPRNDTDPYGKDITWQAGYFNECMSGFEHQVASHLMAEGMVKESLVLTRSIHDRYHATKRNPYNEIECSDHYARAMASYGTFITACGFEYNGPKGYIGFAPKINPDNFKAPFTSAEGWGTFEQRRNQKSLLAKVHIKKGTLSLQKISLQSAEVMKVNKANCSVGNKKIPANITHYEGRTEIQFTNPEVIREGEVLSMEIL